MGDKIRRWLVPDTRRRKIWQGVAYLVIVAIALTAAGIKYATASSRQAPAGIATTPGDAGVKGQGTKGPAEIPPARTVIPSRSYRPVTVTAAPHRRASFRPAPSPPPASSPPPAAVPSVTPSAFVTTPSPSLTSSPEPSPAESSASPSALSATPAASSPAAPEVTPATSAPGALPLTA